MDEQFGFIIDTNEYSGNFERAMCAFMTGRIGECGVGEKYAEMYLEKYEPIENVIEMPDEHDCYRPVEIYPSENIWNDGYGFHFTENESEIALKRYKKGKIYQCKKTIEEVESHRGKNILSWTDEAIDSHIKFQNGIIDETNAMTEPIKYPAYQSVLIHMESRPSSNEIEFLKSRANDFVKVYDNSLKILGFRLFECKPKTTKI